MYFFRSMKHASVDTILNSPDLSEENDLTGDFKTKDNKLSVFSANELAEEEKKEAALSFILSSQNSIVGSYSFAIIPDNLFTTNNFAFAATDCPNTSFDMCGKMLHHDVDVNGRSELVRLWGCLRQYFSSSTDESEYYINYTQGETKKLIVWACEANRILADKLTSDALFEVFELCTKNQVNNSAIIERFESENHKADTKVCQLLADARKLRTKCTDPV